uniref:Integrase catalytic domain-containing protein n=1 Tax=Mustela putorius furo TaxID=9669 RepID=M3XQB0_MUSPF
PSQEDAGRDGPIRSLGTRVLLELLKDQNLPSLTPGRAKELAQDIVFSCEACTVTNVQPADGCPGTRDLGNWPGIFWEVDFTEVTPATYGNKYLLVFIDTFSGWVEAFLTKKEMAMVVAKKILEEIFLRFGLPKVIGSDNGPAFVAQVIGSMSADTRYTTLSLDGRDPT